MPDINRRKLLRSIGAATGAGLTGLGFSTSAVAAEDGPDVTREEVAVSDADIETALEQEAAKTVLQEASLDSLNRKEAKGYETRVNADGSSRTFHEVALPSTDGESTFSYVKSEKSNNVASVKTASGTIIRAIVKKEGIQTEIIEYGEVVTEEALQTLEKSGTKAKIETEGDLTLDTDNTSAYVDQTTGKTHIYSSAKRKAGGEVLLYATISESGSPDSVYVIQQSAIQCFANCMALRVPSLGSICWTYSCSPCVSTLYVPICVACASCGGAIAATCIATCGAEQLL